MAIPLNEQVEVACKQIAQDPRLQRGYNAIGYSQVQCKDNQQHVEFNKIQNFCKFLLEFVPTSLIWCNAELAVVA